MADIEPKEIEECVGEVAIDLTDPNSVADNLDSLSEEQIEELIQKALEINKKLKGCLHKEKRRKMKYGEESSRDVPSTKGCDRHTSKSALPPIRKSRSLVGKDEVVKDLNLPARLGKKTVN